ncbi:MAG: DUF1449 family protein [Phaeodactylibacter sp.]|uniref:hypothetical protein n=1 Tax=Phaeodactylibacter sp. TaxID=1940289 RepID=UPI0032EB2812
MQDLLNAAIAGVNLPFTLLLGLVILYWLSVILGAVDLSAFDFDVDAEVDLDVDADIDTDVDAGGMSGWFAGALHFFNFGRVPFMLVLTATVLTAWVLAILGNHYLGHYSPAYALATAVPILFIGLLVSKVVTTPFVPIFEQISKEAQPMDYIGQACELILPASFTQMGQARVQVEDDELLIYVKTATPELQLPSGAKGVVSRTAPDGSHYLIRPYPEDEPLL